MQEWTEDIEKTFLKTLSCLKSKDPKIYDETVTFFHKPQSPTKNETPQSDTKKEQQPLYLRDYERKIILDKGGVLTDEESGMCVRYNSKQGLKAE